MLKGSNAAKAVILAVAKGAYVQKDGTFIGCSGRPTISKPNRSGYLAFTIKDYTGEYYKGQVHQVQAYQKYGDAIFADSASQIHVRHLDGNRLNNSWDNIAIGTQSDNSMDRPKESRQMCAQIGADIQRRFSDETIREIRRKKAEGASLRTLAKEYDDGPGHISDIVNKRLYKNVV